MNQFVNRPTPENNHKSSSPLPEFFILLTGVGLGILMLVVLIHVAINQLGQFVPFSWERHISPKWSSERHSSLAQQRIDELLLKLLQAQPLPPSMSAKVTVIESDEINAFAGLGGEIVLYSGLIKAMPNENALAMALAHELAHVRARHVIKSVSKGVSLTALMALLGTDNRELWYSTAELPLLAFSRADEEEADRLALNALRILYGHTAGAAELFSVLQQSGTSDWFSSHPSNESRANAVTTDNVGEIPIPLSKDYLNFAPRDNIR